jgi:hypothetical protein
MTDTFCTKSGGSPPDENRLDAVAVSADPYLNVPQELKDLDHWVVWRYETRGGKPTKMPYTPNTGWKADTSDPKTWGQYTPALEARVKFSGVGCVIAVPYVGIDLDKCRNPTTGEIEDWAMEIVREVNSYTELSPTGTGLHIWVRGILPSGKRRAGRVEMYDESRYFTVTGEHLAGTPLTIENRDLTSLHSRIESLDPRNKKPAQSVTSYASSSLKHSELMAGRWKGLYPSQSEADLALCILLARKHGCDAEEIDSEFRNSGLYREKWDRGDYRNQTIRMAIDSVSNSRGLQRPEIAQAVAVSPSVADWRSSFKSYSELEQGENEFLIKGFLPTGITFIGGHPGSGKTWLALSIAKALATGQKFLGHYEVSSATPVLYLIPEAGERAFRSRLEKIKLTTLGDSFLCRTLKDKPPKLDDPNLIGAIQALKPVVILDTAIRFSTAESENSATDNRQLTNGILSLIREGAKGVIGIHHATKSSASQTELTLETALRGSGDLGAICDSAWALKCTDPTPLDINVKCVKARDFEVPPAFRIKGWPHLNDIGDFAVIDQVHSETGDTKAGRFSEFVRNNPEATYRQIEEATGVTASKIRDLGKSAGWTKAGKSWTHDEVL